MEKQETILSVYNKYFTFSLNVLWGVMQIAVLISVIALLYVNEFKGMAILLFLLLKYFVIVVVIGAIVYFYIWLFVKLDKKSKERRQKNKEEFFKEVKKIIKEEIKNATRVTTKRK